jgi:tetrahydromethanopterin S-methyltransferase subunit G
MAAIEHRLVAFHLTDVARADEITDLRRRIEKIERRLDLVDSA